MTLLLVSIAPLGSSCDIYLEMRVDAGIGLGVSHDPQRNFHKSRRVLRRYQSWLNYQHSTHTMVVGKYQTTAPRNEVGFPSIYVSMRDNDRTTSDTRNDIERSRD